MRLFQKDAYIGIDFLNKNTEVVRMKNVTAEPLGKMDFTIDTPSGDKKIISVQMPEVTNNNAIRSELAEFADAIRKDAPVRVSAHDGLQAMEIAHQIIQKMDIHREQHEG